MNYRLSIFQGFAGLLFAAHAWAQSAPANVEPVMVSRQQVLEAAGSNLDVARARGALSGAQADKVSADRSPFPTLSASMGSLDLQNGISGGDNFFLDKKVDKSVGLDWTWERGNKRALRTLTAEQLTQAARADLAETQTQQKLYALISFYDLLTYQERLTHLQAIERSADELSASAQRRLKAGDLSEQEALRTDIERQRAQSELVGAELDRRRAALLLWQVTGLSIEPDRLEARAEWPALDEHPRSIALGPLVDARPDVRADAARLSAAQAAVDAAQAQKISDITWGSSYDHYPGTSNALISLRMQMPLQWGYSYQGEIAKALAQLSQAQDTLALTRRQATTELQRLIQEVDNTAKRARAYNANILPQAQRVAEGAELAYAKGALSLTDLLDARRTLRSTRLEALAARSDHAKALGLWQLRFEDLQRPLPP